MMSLSTGSIVDWAAGVGVALVILSGISLSALGALPRADGPVAPALSTPVPSPVSAERAAELRHLLIQDCGSCHGLTLAGGLGPALQPGNLESKPVEFLAYTILNGRPGTAMPPWAIFFTESEGLWLARELKGLNP